MHSIQKHLAVLLLMAVGFAEAARPASGTPALNERSLPQLQQRLACIDAELKQLASFTLRGGTGALGYRSKAHTKPDSKEWIRIELGEEVAVDQIVLVPVLFRDPETGLRSEGFPVAFRLLTGTAQTTNVVASFSAEDHLRPRIAPLTASFQPVKASWIMIEASILSRRVGSVFHSLNLSEILVFSGMENVALQKTVTVPNKGNQSRKYLTDGFGPYLMDAAQGDRSATKLIHVKKTAPPPTLTIDLNASHPVNQINLHTAGVALSIPMGNFSSWAVPRHVRITGANRPDFMDEIFLCEYKQHSIYDNGPIIMRRFPETRCRYIRLEILDHNPITSLRENPSAIAFTEVEVLSKSKNVALGASIKTSSNLACDIDALLNITDGRNYYGQILPLRDWMEQLALRHDLETERPLVIAELNIRHARQQIYLRRMSWIAALLAAGTIIIVLVAKMIHQRTLFQTRERIAANLHDELGANLHAIALLGDLAKQEIHDAEADEKWAPLIHYINETRTLTEQTAKTTRHCTHMLEAHELHGNLVDEMKRTGERLLTDLEHNISFSETDQLQKLQPRRRVGLYLFYKECLTNIIRHARASRVETRLTADNERICLTVTDNGVGMEEPPPSLKRRARLLKAKLSVEKPDAGGTQITLTLRPRPKKWLGQ